MTDYSGIVLMLAALALGLLFYFLPSIVAVERNHPAWAGVFIVNLIFGWTAIGWIAAFIWAFTGTQSQAARDEPTKTCPDCAEEVKAAARVCRFCGHEFISDLAGPGQNP